MDKLATYRKAILEVLNEYVQYKPAVGDIDVEMVHDVEKDHFELLYLGWKGYKRVHSSFIHIDIIDGKVWIQWDGTESGIAYDLVDKGIKKTDIVLGFRHPEERIYTQYEHI